MKNKKILITSTDVMMLQFLVKHVFYLKEQGFEVRVSPYLLNFDMML